jgi:RNA recognition motif-containing protein
VESIRLRTKVNSKLYIRNFSYSTTENDLRTLFALSGTVVSVDIIKDRVTGRSKGYGFIQMSNPVEAENAVEMFDGWSLDNCELRVGLTQYRERRSNFRDLGTKDSRGLPPRRGYIRSS